MCEQHQSYIIPTELDLVAVSDIDYKAKRE